MQYGTNIATTKRMVNWYNDYELHRDARLGYSDHVVAPAALLPIGVKDQPDRWLHGGVPGGPIEMQPGVILHAGQFVGDMPGTYWGRWGTL